MTTDEIVAEVGEALQRQAGLRVMPALTEQDALSLARNAMSRLCIIRDREQIDPLPHDGMSPAEMLERARRAAREQWDRADSGSYMDALPPLAKVMEALGIEPAEESPDG